MPVTRDDVIRRVPDLMVRFAFMDRTVGEERTAEFLSEYAGEMAGYIPSLQQYLETHASEMPLSSRLALECGIQELSLIHISSILATTAAAPPA